MRKFLCILMCMLMVVAFMPTMAFAEQESAKIEVSVTSGGKILEAKVYEDYSATVIIPASNTKINFASATVCASITGLKGLGMGAEDTRTDKFTITSDVTATATGAELFPKAYTFATRTVVINVNKSSVIYNVEESNNAVKGAGNPKIQATPTDVNKAAAVWAEFANYTTLTNVEQGHKASTPTSVEVSDNTITATFAEKSFLQIGTSKLALKDGYKATVEVKGVSGINSDDITTLNNLYNKVLKGTNIEKSDAVAVENILNKVKVEKEITVTVTFKRVENEPKPIYPWGGGGSYVAPQPQQPEKTLAEKIDEAEDELNAYIADNVFKAKSAKQTKLHGKKAVKVSWNKVKGADGYEVFRSTKKNSGYGTKPYFTTKKTTYTNNKELKKGKTYYYKVRAYKLVDGKKAYSDWSLKAWRTIK